MTSTTLSSPSIEGAALHSDRDSEVKRKLVQAMDEDAPNREKWKRKNRIYHREIEALGSSLVPPGRSVLEIGCSTGGLLEYLRPARGLGVDISPRCIELARQLRPGLRFEVEDAEALACNEKFDFVFISDVVGYLSDVWKVFRNLQRVTTPETRVVITYYNALWEPVLKLAEKLGMKNSQSLQNWLSLDDLENILRVNGYEVIRRGYRLLLPVNIPVISAGVNRFLARLPLLRNLCLIEFIVAREAAAAPQIEKEILSCSVIVPCRNEAGNIDAIVRTIPMMGRHTEILFVDGNSEDGTQALIEDQIQKYKGVKDIQLIHQGTGKGKGDAVRKGFARATGDILFILDADLTVPAEDLPKFYLAIAENHGEFINGTRLVYPMEDQAMRWLNLLGNKFFSLVFTWLLDQKIKDTLCGTKVLSRKNYEAIAANRSYFGDFDPFGDFDLLFGAARLNMQIVQMPVRYRARTYGDTKISRFRHGLLLLRMCGVALRKLKFQ
jgi:SAM-dependent methyltransferase